MQILIQDIFELNFDINTMILGIEFKKYYQSILNDLIIQGKCINDSFDQWEDLYIIEMNTYFSIAKMRKKSRMNYKN